MEKVIEIKTIDPTALLGIGDANIKLIEQSIPAKIIARGEQIKLQGKESDVLRASEVLLEMMQTLSSRGDLNKKDVQQLIAFSNSNTNQSFDTNQISDSIIYFGKNGSVSPKTEGQHRYLKMVKNNDVVFSIGPAGTGKTYLSVAFALAALDANEVDRIILCRPAVEAGESLGFLPGDLKEKVDPYLAPLYDSLHTLYSESKLSQLLKNKIIEVVPLAYMRGRTLDNAYMILDEAQNATPLQMKMFLTRLGVGSRSIITGDITQVDLQNPKESGLLQASEILSGVEGIGFVRLDEKDVVRHPLVMKIIKAYDKD
ncbi:MAG: phosphate starvation protein PhoH [Candidatus Neomarinimicrobiota bacterium]|nr:MAG: phosphate starvation protein PhoH [Candidatus Neomarinimicrobiota bacterium]